MSSEDPLAIGRDLVGDPAGEERDAAHELAEAMRDQALAHDPRDPGMDAAATLWLAAETRAARLDRRCEIGSGGA